MTDTSRGLRNNNPGNLERTDPRAGWLGAVADKDLTDGRFEQFTKPYYGLRALAIVLRNYQDHHGCRTITDIVRRFAPPPENAGSPYVSFVARTMSVSPDTVLDLHDQPTLVLLMESITHYECGCQPYAAALVGRAALVAIHAT